MNALEAYELLAPEYDAQPNALVSLEQRVMAPMLPELSGRVVVDCGAGTGRWSSYCAARGARAVAVDFSHAMLRRASNAVCADVCAVPLRDGSAGVTVSAFAFGYAPQCLSELRRITRVGGTVLISDMHPAAMRRGWTRTFRHGSQVIDVAHEPYELADLSICGLKLVDLIEPAFGEPEREIFERAGQGHRFEEAANGPAIFVASFVRT